jgi:protein-S-isoprenylcysteine O-methyltransferase Ste14
MNPGQRILSPRVLIGILFFIVVVPLLPLLISRYWDWLEAWAYAVISMAGFVISRLLAARRHPDIIAERARFMQHEDTKTWDKRLIPILGIAGIATVVVAGLDELLGWSPGFSSFTKTLSLIVLIAGYALGSYALIENRFFSGTVRIQTDRGHQVVSGGPYRWIRHPGYAGGMLTYLATPLLLDSSWAMIPAVLSAITMLYRTNLEDATLKNELHGYSDYMQHVRFRVLPGVW